MGTVKAVKSFGGKDETRDFSEEVWATGVPTKNKWRKIDHNTEVLAMKLPEQAEIASKRAAVNEVIVPPMPVTEEIPADPERTNELPEQAKAPAHKTRGPNKVKA